MEMTTESTDADTDYPDPSAPGFYPYWLGRIRQALSYLLDHPGDPIARRLASETLDAYGLRTGQDVSAPAAASLTAGHYAGLTGHARQAKAEDPDFWDRCDERQTGEAG